MEPVAGDVWTLGDRISANGRLPLPPHASPAPLASPVTHRTRHSEQLVLPTELSAHR